MMRWVSTGGGAPAVDFTTALFHGLAPDGGLYVPERWPVLEARCFESARTPAATAVDVLAPFLDHLGEETLGEITREALDFPIPLVPLDDDEGTFVLELFHGPTCAFKDVGARVMARLMANARAGDDEPVTILVATSGDTGSAVANAFLGLEGTRVVLLFPRGKVSRLQEQQLTTLGENVRALSVDGTFDDCQRLAKTAFADESLRREVRLTSANSINVGRLLPQATYYVHAAAHLSARRPIRFVTPSGNFGNLYAGLLARRIGMPVDAFVAATNANDVVPELLESGVFTPRPSVETISNAMDVGDPSNLARILHLYGDVDALRRDVTGSRHDDDATRSAIAEVFATTGYVMDPHTAVGWLAHRAVRPPSADTTDVILATAHPAKFREHVEPAIGGRVPLPAPLAECMERAGHAIPIPADAAALREHLLDR